MWSHQSLHIYSSNDVPESDTLENYHPVSFVTNNPKVHIRAVATVVTTPFKGSVVFLAGCCISSLFNTRHVFPMLLLRSRRHPQTVAFLSRNFPARLPQCLPFPSHAEVYLICTPVLTCHSRRSPYAQVSMALKATGMMVLIVSPRSEVQWTL